MIASDIEPARSRRIDFRHLFQIVRLAADDQFRHVNIADMIEQRSASSM